MSNLDLINCMVSGMTAHGWRVTQQGPGDLFHPSLARPDHYSVVLERPYTGFGPTRVVLVQNGSGGVEIQQVTDWSLR